MARKLGDERAYSSPMLHFAEGADSEYRALNRQFSSIYRGVSSDEFSNGKQQNNGHSPKATPPGSPSHKKKGQGRLTFALEGQRHPLFDTVALGDIPKVQFYLDKGEDLHMKDEGGGSLLHEAAFTGHSHLTQILIDRGLHVDLKDDYGRTPLHKAAYNGHEAVCTVLIKNGASLGVQDLYEKTPIQLAQQKKHKNVVTLLEKEWKLKEREEEQKRGNRCRGCYKRFKPMVTKRVQCIKCEYFFCKKCFPSSKDVSSIVGCCTPCSEKIIEEKYAMKKGGESKVEEKDPFGGREIKDIVVGQKINKGHFGTVYSGMAWGNTTVALKQLKQEEFNDFIAEVEILTKLVHPNVVQFLGLHISAKGEMFIVMEYVEKGSLLELLQRQQEPLPIVTLAIEAANGMSFLEQKNIVHRDLAARNLLVDAKDRVKVADFGLSRNIGADYYLSSDDNKKVPIKWSAPESLKFNKFSSKSDSWAFGVVLYEMTTGGAVPYIGMTNQEVIHKVLNEKYRLPRPEKCPEELYDLMKMCWAENPNDRPSFKMISNQLIIMFEHERAAKYQPIPQYDPKNETADDEPDIYNNVAEQQEARRLSKQLADAVI